MDVVNAYWVIEKVELQATRFPSTSFDEFCEHLRRFEDGYCGVDWLFFAQKLCYYQEYVRDNNRQRG